MSKSTSTEEQMKRMNILRQLPDTALFAIYAEMFGESCLNKKLVIKRILQRGDVKWQVVDGADDADVEGEKMKANAEVKQLIQVMTGLSNEETQTHTTMTLKSICDDIFDIPSDKMILWKDGLPKNMFTWLKWISEVADPQDFYDKSVEIKARFREMVFDTVSRDLHKQMLHNICTDARSVFSLQHHQTAQKQFAGYEHVLDILASGMKDPAANLDDVENKDALVDEIRNRVCPGIDEFASIQVQKVAHVVETEPEPEPEPAPEPEPEPAPEPAPAPPTPAEYFSDPEINPQVGVEKCIICKKPLADHIRENVGDVVNPGKFCPVNLKDFTKKSWTAFRKKHNIKGRVNIFRRTDLSQYIAADGSPMFNDLVNVEGQKCIGTMFIIPSPM